MAIISGIVSQSIGTSNFTYQGWRVFVDFNGNGILDGNDLSSITNTSGAYSIDVVSPLPGTYEVRVQAPDGGGGFVNPKSTGGGLWNYTNPTTYDPDVDDNFYLSSFSTTQTVLGLVNFDDAAARFAPSGADNQDLEANQVLAGVGFNFINQANGSMFVEQTGQQSNDTHGFVNDKLSGPLNNPNRVPVFDVENEGSLGSYFLRAGGLQSAPGGGGEGNNSTVPQLLIQYLNSGTNVVSGEIWDIDADGTGFEKWKVEAFDTLTPIVGTDTPLDSIESGIGVSYWNGNTANGASLDGKAWTWNLDSTEEIKSVLITFTGSKPNAFVGLAFDNFQAYTYTTATPTTANFNLTKTESVPLPKTCFGGSEGTNDPTAPIGGSWGAATFAYILRNGTTNTSSTTVFTDVVAANSTAINTVDPIQDNKDFGVISSSLPTDAKGLGVGRFATNISNYSTGNSISDQNPEIQQGDQLRAYFGQSANTAEIQLRLFFEKESVSSKTLPEQLTYQLQKSDGSGGYTNVGGLVTVTSDNNQSYAAKSGTTNPGIPGVYTFTVNSSTDFDTILFGGADYYNASTITSPTRTDTSDYLLNKVCLTDFGGDGANILSGADIGKDFLYSSIADGGDTINDFGSDDRIVIDLSGFGSGITSSNFSYAGGVLSFDQDGVTGITVSGANTNGYNNATDRVTLATLTGAPSSANLSFI